MQKKFDMSEALHIVKLKEEQGLSYRDIATKMRAGYGTVYRAYQWAKELIRTGQIDYIEGEIVEGISSPVGVRVTQEGPNKIILQNEKGMITSLEELLEVCNVDLETWQVIKHELNAWPGWAKHEETHLDYTDGRASGTIDKSGDLITKQLIQVKAWLIRRDPIPVTPLIQVAPSFNFKPPDPPDENITDKVNRALITGDWQLGFKRNPNGSFMTPFHDRRVLDLVLQVAAILQPERVVLLGDMIDLPEWSSRFRKDPGFYWTTQPTLFEAHYWLLQLRSILPDSDIVYLEGNHEQRLPHAVIDYLPAAYMLKPIDMTFSPLTLPHLLGLDGLGIEYLDGYPNNDLMLCPTLRVAHGNVTRSNPGDTAKIIAGRSIVSNIYGHGHKLELVGSVQSGGLGDIEVEAASPGCGCRVDYTVPGHNYNQVWRQGLMIAEYTSEGDHSIIPYPIREGSMVYGGEVLRARPKSIEDLEQAYPEWQWTTPGLEWWQ